PRSTLFPSPPLFRSRRAPPEGRAGTGSLPEIAGGVDRLVLDPDLVVQVRAGRAPGIAGECDDISALHFLVHGDVELGEVAVERLCLIAVLDDQRLAVFGIDAREDHGAGRGGLDGRAHPRADVEPAVELRVGRPGRGAAALARIALAAHGPARRQRRQHARGAAEEALESAEAVPLVLDDARQPFELVADSGMVGGLDGSGRAGATPDASASLGGAVLGTEGLPDLGAQLAPAVDLGADLPHPRLPAVDDLLLLHDAHAELVQRRALSAQCEVVRVDDGDGGGHRQEESQHRQDEPPRKGQPGDASPVPVDHQEIELAPRQHHSQRLIGTTERSRVGSPSVLGFTLFIRQWPSKITPSSTTTTGASTSPKTRAARLSSTRSAAETLPTTSPLMSTCPRGMFRFS